MPGWPRLKLAAPGRLGLPLAAVGLFLLAFAQPGKWGPVPAAQAQELQVEATSIQHDKEEGIYRYEDAQVNYRGLILNAQKFEIHTAAKRAYATGQVRFREGSMSGRAERLEIDLDQQTITLFDTQIFDSKNGYYIDAAEAFRPTKGRYIARDCTLTSCSPKQNGWKIYAGEIDYRADDFATGTNAVLKLGPVPVFYFPWMAWPTVQKRRSGFLAPTLTFQESTLPRFDLGTRLTAPFFWAIDIDHDLTLTPEYIHNRGLASGWDYNYTFWEDQSGRLQLFTIDEAKTRLSANENIPPGVTPEDEFKASRYALDWGHNQGFGERQRIILTLNQSSDGQVRREYLDVVETRPHEEYQGAYSAMTRPVSVSVLAEKTSEFTDESIFANSSAFTDGAYRPRLLPRVAFNTGGQPLSAIPLGLELSGHVTRFVSDGAISGEVSELRPAITLPLRLGGSFELRSSVARRFVQYEDLTETVRTGTENELTVDRFAQNEIEIELRASWARVYPAEAPGERAIKHRIIPRLVFFELEDKRQPLAGSLSLAELEAGTAIAEDDLRAGVQRSQFVQRLITLRLDNSWMQRVAGLGGVVEFAHFNIIQPYNLLFDDADFSPIGPTPDPDQLESEPGEPLMPLILEGGISLPGFSASSALRYHHQRNEVTSRNVSVSGSVSPRATMGLSFDQNLFSYRTPDNKLRSEGARLTFNGNFNISSYLSLGYGSVVNLRDAAPPLNRRVESTSVNIDYHPGCYSLRVDYNESLAVTQVGGQNEAYIDQTILVTFTLGNLGSFENRISPDFANF